MNHIISFFFLFLIFGCSGGGSGTGALSIGSESNFSFSGLVVDGLISGASVCLDININGVCDPSEPTTQTSANGEFSFNNVEIDSGKLIPIIARGGVDTATGLSFSGELKKIIDPSDSSNHSITPLTDLSATSFLSSETKDSVSLAWANAMVANVLQITMSDIEKNPLTDPLVFSKTQELIQLKMLLETTSFKASGVLLDEDKNQIRKEITKSLAEQVEADFFANRLNIDINGVIGRIEGGITSDNPSFDIPANESSFIIEQMDEIKNTLAEIELTNDLSKLSGYQAGLVEELALAQSALLSASGGLVIGVVPISDDPSSLYKDPATPPSDDSGGSNGGGDTGGGDTGGGDTGGGDTDPVGPSDPTPIAVAPSSFSTISKSIRLDGSNSRDPNNLVLSYLWTFVSKPVGSVASFSNSTSATPTLSLDKFGTYTISLNVNNGAQSDTVSFTITLERSIEYTNAIAINSVDLISDHLTKNIYGNFVNDFYYDLSKYTTLESTKINSNGIRIEKMNLASDSTESLSNYDSTSPIYRLCTSNYNCIRGFTHKTDKDKVFFENINYVNKTGREYVITSNSATTDTYIQKSNWNVYLKNDSFYLFRKLFIDLSSSNFGRFDIEIIKLDNNFQKKWNTLIKTSSYGTGANNVSSYDVYSPNYLTWANFEIYNGKLVLQNSTSGGRSNNDYFVLNDSNGEIEDNIRYRIYESNNLIASQSYTLVPGANGKIYFHSYYNSVTKPNRSTINGLVFFNIDTSFNPSSATAVTSNDPNYYFYATSMSSEQDAFFLNILSNTTGEIIQSKLGSLKFNNLAVNKINITHDLQDQWGVDYVSTLLNDEFKFLIDGSYYSSQLTYVDQRDTRAYQFYKVNNATKRILSIRFGSSYDANEIIELNSSGQHAGCFEPATSNNVITEHSFLTKSLEVRKSQYEKPSSVIRDVVINSHPRNIALVEVEERAPWLCSLYAMDLDLTIRVKPGSTINSHTHDTGHYRYTLISSPTKGAVRILQPSNISISGNTIVTYTANSNAQGTDSFTLRADDGTGTKLVNVSVIFK